MNSLALSLAYLPDPAGKLSGAPLGDGAFARSTVCDKRRPQQIEHRASRSIEKHISKRRVPEVSGGHKKSHATVTYGSISFTLLQTYTSVTPDESGLFQNSSVQVIVRHSAS